MELEGTECKHAHVSSLRDQQTPKGLLPLLGQETFSTNQTVACHCGEHPPPHKAPFP